MANMYLYINTFFSLKAMYSKHTMACAVVLLLL